MTSTTMRWARVPCVMIIALAFFLFAVVVENASAAQLAETGQLNERESEHVSGLLLRREGREFTDKLFLTVETTDKC